jgi:hypothetical protein
MRIEPVRPRPLIVASLAYIVAVLAICIWGLSIRSWNWPAKVINLFPQALIMFALIPFAARGSTRALESLFTAMLLGSIYTAMMLYALKA